MTVIISDGDVNGAAKRLETDIVLKVVSERRGFSGA